MCAMSTADRNTVQHAVFKVLHGIAFASGFLGLAFAAGFPGIALAAGFLGIALPAPLADAGLASAA